MIANTFENNLIVEAAFNKLIDKSLFVKHEGKETQHRIGDYYSTLLGFNIDYKVDCYDNNNIVLEVNQISGTNWIDELDKNTFIGYVKINTGVIYFWKVSQLIEFRSTFVYKNRKEFTAWSKTTYKNFKISELPNPAFLHKVNNETLLPYLKKDIQGDSKYDNIAYRRIINE